MLYKRYSVHMKRVYQATSLRLYSRIQETVQVINERLRGQAGIIVPSETDDPSTTMNRKY